MKRYEIWVQSFSEGSGRRQVSNGGGAMIRADGAGMGASYSTMRQNGKMMAIQVGN
jgi:hypothetical protein